MTKISISITLDEQLLKDIDELRGTAQGAIPRSRFIEIILSNEIQKMKLEQEAQKFAREFMPDDGRKESH